MSEPIVPAAVDAYVPPPNAPILPSWKKVRKWYNGRKQTKAAAAYFAAAEMYHVLGKNRW